MPFPPTFPGLYPEGQAGELVRGLRRRPGAEFLDRHRAHARRLRRCAQAMERHAQARRRLEPRHASAPSHLRHRRVQHSTFPDLPGLKDFAGEVVHSGSFHDAARLEGPQGAGDRHRHQRPRRGAGAARARRRRHHHPAQQDLRGEPEGSAKRLRHLLRRHPVRRLRPARDLVPLSGAAARLSALHHQEQNGRPQADQGAGSARLQDLVRRGRDRLPDDVSALRRRLLLQCRLLRPDRLRRRSSSCSLPTSTASSPAARA